MHTRKISLTVMDWERFVEYVEDMSNPMACWNWKAGHYKKGYGVFNLRDGAFPAHRISYTWLKGEIPEGLTMDHLCRNRSCVNPEHMEPVTQEENTKRGNSGINMRSRTHCPRGHEHNEQNTKITVAGTRQCMVCLKQLNHEAYLRRKERLGPEGLKEQWRLAHDRQKARKDRNFCLRGHPLSGDNVQFKKGHRICKACRRIYNKQTYDRCYKAKP